MDRDIRVDKKGRILIPKEIRERLNIKPGTKLFPKIEAGRLVLLKATSVREFQSEVKNFQEKLRKLTKGPIPTEKLF
ncbi:MAG: AbrB/MazE/SpoVT family DNA-binding domain-containing protein [Candidatus Heimdallarchaeota archaeon]|nr:AbrB/MazE/SpoVT family DNA-binding domain-containing protein [Candidatus Heimdallarchaeota archaeon]